MVWTKLDPSDPGRDPVDRFATPMPPEVANALLQVGFGTSWSSSRSSRSRTPRDGCGRGSGIRDAWSAPSYRSTAGRPARRGRRRRCQLARSAQAGTAPESVLAVCAAASLIVAERRFGHERTGRRLRAPPSTAAERGAFADADRGPVASRSMNAHARPSRACTSLGLADRRTPCQRDRGAVAATLSSDTASAADILAAIGNAASKLKPPLAVHTREDRIHRRDSWTSGTAAHTPSLRPSSFPLRGSP